MPYPRFLPTGLLLLVATLVSACAGTRAVPADDTLNAALWVQSAAEYRAATLQTYRAAAAHLPDVLGPDGASALPDDPGPASQPPAVIVDVDETVLDNSPFQARLIAAGRTYDPALWDAWVQEAQAEPVPGALAFLQEAARQGVTVFYVTNRDAEQEAATRANLEREGFPLAEGVDVLLMRGEQEGWGSDKTPRRALVAGDYRVVMLFGDDLNDFVEARRAPAERRALVEQHAECWGRQWFVLPNPVYGSWERAAYGFESGLPLEDQRTRKRGELDPAQ